MDNTFGIPVEYNDTLVRNIFFRHHYLPIVYSYKIDVNVFDDIVMLDQMKKGITGR